jgi:hypothetical protein
MALERESAAREAAAREAAAKEAAAKEIAAREAAARDAAAREAALKKQTPRDATPPKGTPPRDVVARNDVPATPPANRTPPTQPRESETPPSTTPPRDARQTPPREGGVRDTPRVSEPTTRGTFDEGSASAFRSSRSTSSTPYADSPSRAAAVARITYTLEAYSEAVEHRDLDALRDVRNPITQVETSLINASGAATTIRFSDVDVALDGTEAVVRCRRVLVSGGKTRSSGLVEVHLTRRPAGWVITDIR